MRTLADALSACKPRSDPGVGKGDAVAMRCEFLLVLHYSLTRSHTLMRSTSNLTRLTATAFVVATALNLSAAESSASPSMDELAAQNRRLQEQVDRQARMLDELGARLTELQRVGSRTDQQLSELHEQIEKTGTVSAPATRDRDHEVRIYGEAGLAFFSTGKAGQFPNSEFRIDDAKVFLETPVLRDTYFFSELQLFARESGDASVQIGEVYVDFENVSGRVNGPDRLVNVRVGRMNIPFGEEYLVRGPVDNPLISHSLADFWGFDAGVELYGSRGDLNYVFAVQNGGFNASNDHDSDKSVTARIGWDPLPWLKLSASAMRTGDLRVDTAATPGDGLSAVWFGNGFFRQLGSSATTTSFHANLWQGDASARWKSGHVGASLGGASFDDNDKTADNSRTLTFGSLELVQSLADDLYGAARFSRIDAPGGYPLVGWGDFGRYFFAPPLTSELSRVSVGLGYRIGPPLVLKLEYTYEWGHQTNGAKRDQENFLGSELGLKF